MIPVVTLIVVVALSIAVTRAASILLVHTGVSRELARFQARSAFTGVGFTTSESENIVNHPVRRRIVMTLMLLGNAGFVTVISTLILGFVDREKDTTSLWVKLAFLFGGLGLVFLVGSSHWLDRRISIFVRRALRRWTDLDARDYAGLLDLAGDYGIIEMLVEEEDWITGKTLEEARLPDEGVLVLGVTRANGAFLGAPVRTTLIQAGNTLVLYGRAPAVVALDRRRKGRSGDRAHSEAVVAQTQIVEDESKSDSAGAGSVGSDLAGADPVLPSTDESEEGDQDKEAKPPPRKKTSSDKTTGKSKKRAPKKKTGG